MDPLTDDVRTPTQRRHDDERARQTEALTALGYSAAWPGGDWMSPTYTTCQTCAVPIRVKPDELELHTLWHEQINPS